MLIIMGLSYRFLPVHPTSVTDIFLLILYHVIFSLCDDGSLQLIRLQFCMRVRFLKALTQEEDQYWKLAVELEGNTTTTTLPPVDLQESLSVQTQLATYTGMVSILHRRLTVVSQKFSFPASSHKLAAVNYTWLLMPRSWLTSLIQKNINNTTL